MSLPTRMKIMRAIEQLRTNNPEVPQDYICPLTLEIYNDPVFADDGHTYEREEIQKWIDSGKKISPNSGAEMTSTKLISNHKMRSLVSSWKDEHEI
jgi:pyridoxal/pyridoxine/pyridoxamine kinase